MKISFVVPTYMEELNIESHYKECIKSFHAINKKYPQYESTETDKKKGLIRWDVKVKPQ